MSKSNDYANRFSMHRYLNFQRLSLTARLASGEWLRVSRQFETSAKNPSGMRFKMVKHLVFPIDLYPWSDRLGSLPTPETLPTKFVIVLTVRDNRIDGGNDMSFQCSALYIATRHIL